MLISTNIDRTDSRLNTKAPFQWDCHLKIGETVLPAGAFLSIRIQCTENIRPPVRLHSVSVKGPAGSAEFRDADGTVVGTWALFISSLSMGLISSFIYSPEGVIIGQITCDSDTPALLLGAARNVEGKTVTDNNDFKLLPQCHIPSLAGLCKSFNINGKTRTTDTILSTGTRTEAKFEAGTYTISLMGAYKEPPAILNGITSITVDGISIDAKGKHLLVHHGITSNLRVLNQGSTIQFKGVKDV